ncbi:ATP synthase subunit b precursor [Planctomycetes bacterium Pan216]|uniref:ATP synthase subunit b n=1 Tax=Kolteria novifilia TaxID=2527975 RepID=A0A518B8C3_9BACT|nr:ATP synthase subunit b precursor [Planctomycetes bacterium Pan216]
MFLSDTLPNRGSLGRLSIRGIVMALLLFGASPALAAETEHPPEEGVAAEHGGAAEESGEGHGSAGHQRTLHGKPHLPMLGEMTEFLDPSPYLFVWTVLIFIVLNLILGPLVWKPVLRTMNEREQKIADAASSAERVRAEAQRLLDEQEDILGKAHEQARELLEQAREKAAHESDALLAEARASTEKAQQEAREEIESQKTTALGEIRDSASRLAAGMAGKLIGQDINPDEYQHLVGEGDS